MGRKIANTSLDSQSSRHLRWEIIEKIIREGIPALEPVKGIPKVQIFVAAGGSSLGARFYTKTEISLASPLEEVAIRHIGNGKNSALEVSTTNSDLFRDFYGFCCAVADRVQLEHEPVEGALAKTLKSWATLIRQKSLLSIEKQIGLLGELLFLRRIARVRGLIFAANSWQGPGSEEHDFTLATVDVEVKSTRSERRLHQIGSLTQMVPKLNRPLFVISIQLTQSSGDESFSLPQLISATLSGVRTLSSRAAERVRLQIERLGWADQDAPHYETRYQLRAPLVAVPVDERFPAIVPDVLVGLGAERLSRIERVGYSVDLSGLGIPDGNGKFDQLLFPKASSL